MAEVTCRAYLFKYTVQGAINIHVGVAQNQDPGYAGVGLLFHVPNPPFWGPIFLPTAMCVCVFILTRPEAQGSGKSA